MAAAVRELDATTHKSLQSGLDKIDDAVFDLFALSDHERLVVRDGLARAKREYVTPRLLSDYLSGRHSLMSTPVHS